jgi:hypothetical protein
MTKPLRARPVRTLPATVVAATMAPLRVREVVTATYDTSRCGEVERVDADGGGAIVRWADALCGWAPRSMLAVVSS